MYLVGKESCQEIKDYMKDSDRYIGAICLVISPSMCYLIDYVEYPKDLLTELDRTFSKHNEDHYRNLEIKTNTIRFLYSKLLASISLMKLFNMKKKQNLPHMQFELKKVSLE